MKAIGTASRSVSGNASVTIPVSDAVAAGNSVVVAVTAGTFAGAVGCSDSKGNTYTVDATVTGQGRLFVCSSRTTIALAAGDTITATYPGFSGLSTASATEYSGLSGVDQTRTATGNSATPTSGAVTTTHPNELIFGAVSYTSTPTFTAGCGLVVVGAIGTGSGSGTRLNPAYQVASGSGPYSACGTLSSSRPWVVALVTYF